MTKSFFLCYSGSDRYGNNYTPYKAVVHTAEEAISEINTWKTYGKKNSTEPCEQIKVNAPTEKKIRDLFSEGFVVTNDGIKVSDYVTMRTTGCGCYDIVFTTALADTLEEHERIYNERREAARQERMRQAEAAKQRRQAELDEQRRGWYHVSVEIRLYVFVAHGNDRMPYAHYSCDLIADSGMDAYYKAVQCIKDHPEELTTRSMERRGDFASLQSVCDPTSGGYEFTFLGVKTDEGYSVDKWNEWKEKGEI